MQEQKTNGETVLTDGATLSDIERALMDKQNAAIHLYRAGESVTLPSGTRYRIGERGNWIRIKGDK